MFGRLGRPLHPDLRLIVTRPAADPIARNQPAHLYMLVTATVTSSPAAYSLLQAHTGRQLTPPPCFLTQPASAAATSAHVSRLLSSRSIIMRSAVSASLMLVVAALLLASVPHAAVAQGEGARWCVCKSWPARWWWLHACKAQLHTGRGGAYKHIISASESLQFLLPSLPPHFVGS